MVDRKIEMKEASRRFVSNMKKTDFVVDMLRGAGVNKPPCFCCLHNMQGTCVHTVGGFDCKDYVLYSRSPAKVERKLLSYITFTNQKQDAQRNKRAA